MDYAEPGKQFRFPGLPQVFAEFGRPVLVLARPEVGSVCMIGTGSVDGTPWTVDAEYLDQVGSEMNRMALVRTHRPVESRMVDRDPLSLLRSAFSYFFANAADTGSADEQRQVADDARAVADAAVARPAELRIDGVRVGCVALGIGDRQGLVVEHGDVVVTVVLAAGSDCDVELVTVPRTPAAPWLDWMS
ncbi:hypothetical protein SAMN04488074_103322 [Lentzea albidocapillata subsp. violacea]|uniref:Uncharacterized protein n=1 Tax=Lentzea albidocapillata subsp. violacea TaxID=128104 RepID=A0A1G8WY01_9PSEU|nr:hypothetical protein [Lentzea albidocapillata]SDJ83093.1 hypothetical protein SAMN04488074_103322 [Lentzea albidocapillata subsp. violacea]